MSKKLRNIGIVSLLTVVSRVLGLVRDSLSLAAWQKLQQWAQTQSVAFEHGVPGAHVIRFPNADHFVRQRRYSTVAPRR